MWNIQELHRDWLKYPQPSTPTIIDKLLKQGFNEEQIAAICDAIDTTCNSCWDTDLGMGSCYCMIDDS